MITCKLLLCAEGLVRDADDGGTSVFNILDTIQAAGFPFFFQRIAVFALLNRLPEEDPNQCTIRFRLAIDQTELAKMDLAVDFLNGTRNRSYVRIYGLVIPHPGTLFISVLHEDRVLATYDLFVEQMKTPPTFQAIQAPAAAVTPEPTATPTATGENAPG